MKATDHIKIALESISGNKLRAGITAVIIAVGITALVGILTSIDGIKASINQNFSEMGANSFSIQDRSFNVFSGGRKQKSSRMEKIRYREAQEFKNAFAFPALVSVSANASFNAVVKSSKHKTDPNISILGVDENYSQISGYSILKGRDINRQDVELQSNIALLGYDVANRIFPKENPLDKQVLIGSTKYRVIGVMNSKGSASGKDADRTVHLAVSTVKEKYASNKSYMITCGVSDPELLDAATAEARLLFRNIRRLNITDEDNFNIEKSDSLAEELIGNLQYMTMAATIIGIITLLGAMIGLMNIMLVSVTERTKEIGTRKAMGATAGDILNQFLVEALVICQIGGLGGIVFGIIIGNIVSNLVGAGFIVPWVWMITGVVVCLIVGLAAGIYPARKAAVLDPIEALRFE